MTRSAVFRIVNRVFIRLAGSDPLADGLFGLEIRERVLSNTRLLQLCEEGDALLESIRLGFGLLWLTHGGGRDRVNGISGAREGALGGLEGANPKKKELTVYTPDAHSRGLDRF